MRHSIIVGTGSYLPPERIPNRHFLRNEFYDAKGNRIEKPNAEIIERLYDITGIKERRWIGEDLTTSDMAAKAAEQALEGFDRERLDYIIVAQNVGDVAAGHTQPDTVPAVAARVKHKLRIKNPYTVAYDLPFGCPGWLQATISADCYIRSGHAQRILVIGAETLSRISDPHDVDCMIFADGAGAALLTATEKNAGILSHLARSDTYENVNLLRMGRSYNPRLSRNGDLFIKMDGHDIYKYALKTVPLLVKSTIEKAGFHLRDIKKILIHQANEKMDEAIVRRLFNLYGEEKAPAGIMPMTISWAGNSSVATLPTLFDLIQRGRLSDHELRSGDVIVFASVGAGMNINSMIYRMP